MVVRWELEGSGGRTYLTVVQSGFSSEAHAAGWSVGLASRVASLKRMLEVGVDWRPVERLQHAAEPGSHAVRGRCDRARLPR